MIAGFLLGWIACSVAVAFALGALIRHADLSEPQPPVVEDEPLRIPQEWLL